MKIKYLLTMVVISIMLMACGGSNQSNNSPGDETSSQSGNDLFSGPLSGTWMMKGTQVQLEATTINNPEVGVSTIESDSGGEVLTQLIVSYIDESEERIRATFPCFFGADQREFVLTLNENGDYVSNADSYSMEIAFEEASALLSYQAGGQNVNMTIADSNIEASSKEYSATLTKISSSADISFNSESIRFNQEIGDPSSLDGSENYISEAACFFYYSGTGYEQSNLQSFLGDGSGTEVNNILEKKLLVASKDGHFFSINSFSADKRVFVGEDEWIYELNNYEIEAVFNGEAATKSMTYIEEDDGLLDPSVSMSFQQFDLKPNKLSFDGSGVAGGHLEHSIGLAIEIDLDDVIDR